METISTIISDIVKIIAEMGAGCVSAGLCYEPKMPKSLEK
jgi:cyclic lactone autoinducer peptide